MSAKLGKDTNSGTQGSPLASLTHAVEVARSQPQHRVFACGETWTEPLVVPVGVSLYGGFDCTDSWKYKGELWRVTISTGSDQIPIKTDGIGGHITISDCAVHAADASIPGGSSIGVFIPDAAEVLLHRCEIIAGNGARGADGDPGGDPLANGASGNDGAGACSAGVGKGGAAPQAACGAATSTGGKGGDGGDTAADGEPGVPNPNDPQNPLAGAAGKGQKAAAGCSLGKDGADGAGGEFGNGAVYDGNADGFGHLTKDGYVGVPGQDGKPGAPGQGGGGGGASLGGAAVCGAAAPGGAGGGSGGAGGCGGAGGKGGRPGGSSFAVASRAQNLSILGCKLAVGHGGNGGDGGAGQEGGEGGPPGNGGAGKGSLSPGCSGGNGGRGGAGGPGGGGFGGHAVAVATLAGTLPFWDDTTFPTNALGGEGGTGGPPIYDSKAAALGAPGRSPPKNDWIDLEP